MAARGNRITGVGRFGVALLATAAVALASLQPAYAEESAPPPASESANAGTNPAPPAAQTTESQPAPADPAPTATPTPPSADAPAGPSPAPSADAPEDEASASPAAPAPDAAETKPAETKPAETKPTPTPAPVKLEPAPAAPAPAAAAPAAPAPAAAASAGPPATVVALVQDAPAAADTAAGGEAAKTEADLMAAAAIVSFRPRPATGPISLPPQAETAAKAPHTARTVPTGRKPLVRAQTCARPAARVPLSARCKRVRAVASLQVTFTYPRSSPEVRAAIAEGAARVAARRADAPPPPKSKAAKKRPVAEVRPIVPFGDSGQGVTNDGFNSSSGSSSSSRLFALAVVPLRVPWPFRFARLRLPSTRPQGVIAAPPSARPG